jgi:hypothetical protein
MDQLSAETIAMINAAWPAAVAGGPEALRKAGYVATSTSTQGPQGYDLSPVVLVLYPFLTPFRNTVPREAGGFGSATQWKAYTGIDSTIVPAGVSEGNRTAVQTPTFNDYSAKYKGWGKEHSVTWESEYGAQGYIDLRERAQVENLQATMQDEEWFDLFGNTTSTGIALGTANTPVGTLVIGKGTMTTQANVCYAVGLTGLGWRYNQYGNAAAITAGVKLQYTRTNADTSTDVIMPGHGIISAESVAVTTAAANRSVTWKVLPKAGEVAWAWYVGLTGAANCKLAAITSIPVFTQTVDAVGTQAANAADLGVDNSQDPLSYDGVLTQVAKSGSGGYFIILGGGAAGGATLTPNGLAGVVEIDAVNLDRYNNYKLGVQEWWVNAQQAGDIQNKILSNSAGTDAGISRVFYQAGLAQQQATIGGFGRPEFPYINRYNGEIQMIRTHPWIPAGTMIGTSRTIPYANNGVSSVWTMKLRKEYYSKEWPERSRKYEFGQYADGVLRGHFPPANAVISGILPG